LRERGDDRHRSFAVAEDERDLFSGQRRIDRHCHAAGRQDREIDEEPLRPAFREQSHPLARLQSEILQAKTNLTDPLDQLAAACRHDPIAITPSEQIGFREPSADEEREQRDRLRQLSDFVAGGGLSSH
jgi:hypothetical protein